MSPISFSAVLLYISSDLQRGRLESRIPWEAASIDVSSGSETEDMVRGRNQWCVALLWSWLSFIIDHDRRSNGKLKFFVPCHRYASSEIVHKHPLCWLGASNVNHVSRNEEETRTLVWHESECPEDPKVRNWMIPRLFADLPAANDTRTIMIGVALVFKFFHLSIHSESPLCRTTTTISNESGVGGFLLK
jgi:hypothetical protein